MALVVVVVGNAASATKIQTARKIGITGGVTGTPTNFNGTADINIPVTEVDASKLTGTASVPTTGNSGTATKLKTARKINGTNFDGSGDITTSKWGTARTIGLSGAVSGSASVDGSGNVTINVSQANIAILTGSFTATAETAARVKTIAYPTGFNKSNCVIIAYGRQYSENIGYAFGHHSNDSAGMMYASNDGNACLAPDNIELWYRNIAQSNMTISYKLVLLKIS